MIDHNDHPEYRALLETVLLHPDDDAPRLILADWVRDHGDDDRADLIQAQCKLMMKCTGCNGEGEYDADHRPGKMVCQMCFGKKVWTEDAIQLRYRVETRLAYGDSLTGCLCTDEPQRYYAELTDIMLFERGFATRVKMSCASFMESGYKLIGRHPVIQVHLPDKCPYYKFSMMRRSSLGVQHGALDLMLDAKWYISTHDTISAQWTLPPELFARLPRTDFTAEEFDDNQTPTDAANAALSTACIAYAKQRLEKENNEALQPAVWAEA